jgi:hypothetical protein
MKSVLMRLYCNSFSNKAERRLQESSQKLDLLQCSLEKLMPEVSPEQAAIGIFKDEGFCTPPSYADRKAVGLGRQQYSAITKPAALTGQLNVSVGYEGMGI